MSDPISLAYFELQFKVSFMEKRGQEFQSFFSSIMEKRYPGDFMRVRPWGNSGDRKNDGYLRSRRMLFQSYAPNELTAADCVAKIDDDFRGALPYWQQYFVAWTFVHNAREGLGPQVAKKLLDLAGAHRQITIVPWGYEELRREAMSLDDNGMESLLGPAPSSRHILALGLEDLGPMLDHIALLPVARQQDLRPVPSDKLERNLLSDSVATLLRAGMSRADLVSEYFNLKPVLGKQITAALKAHYKKLRNSESSPDDVFTAMQRFAGGALVPSAARQSAVLACLAFLFEECEIFERRD